MSLAYIRKQYGVPAKRGGRVCFTWKGKNVEGTITGASLSHSSLRIRMDGEKRSGYYHPTFELKYLNGSKTVPQNGPKRKLSGAAAWLWYQFHVEPSPIGTLVCDILDEVFDGIHHLNQTSLRKVNWADANWIEICICGPMATADDDRLTRLVILCHEAAVRCQIQGAAPGALRLWFYPRRSTGDWYHRHPPLEEAVERVRERIMGRATG